MLRERSRGVGILAVDVDRAIGPVAAAIAGAGVWVLVVGCGAAAWVAVQVVGIKSSAPSGRQPSSPAMIEYHP